MQVRMALEGDVTDATPNDPGQEQVKFQTSFGVRVEGWQMDMRDLVLPAFWLEIIRVNAEVSPGVLENLYTRTFDLRDECQNPNILTRDGIPAAKP